MSLVSYLPVCTVSSRRSVNDSQIINPKDIPIVTENLLIFQCHFHATSGSYLSSFARCITTEYLASPLDSDSRLDGRLHQQLITAVRGQHRYEACALHILV